jgi:hypothetical protein
MTIDDMIEWDKSRVIVEDATLISDNRQCVKEGDK